MHQITNRISNYFLVLTERKSVILDLFSQKKPGVWDFIHIVNLTKPGTNRHKEIHEKALEEQKFLGASGTFINNLLMWFILFLIMSQNYYEK